jgi:hypothetical protein
VVTLRIDENLSLVFQASESLRVENPVAIPLKCGPHRIGQSGILTAGGFGAPHREGRKVLRLARFG